MAHRSGIAYRIGAFVLLALIVGGLCPTAFADAPLPPVPPPPEGGTLSAVEVPAPSLAGARLQEPLSQPARVYLPPSYGSTTRSYPVVYLLQGFGGGIGFSGAQLSRAMDRAMTTGGCPEAIVVLPNALDRFGGGFYTNGAATGNWGDFIALDLVSWVDSHYRTLARPGGRAIVGHSMGGSGAMDIGLRNPERFSVVYALSPGVFSSQGLEHSQMFSSKALVRKCAELVSELAAMPPEAASARFRRAVSSLGPDASFAFAYGSAFAPLGSGTAPYATYPYTVQGGELVRDDATWHLWVNGFGGWDTKVTSFRQALVGMRGFALEVGTRDGYRWIPEGCAYLDALLTTAGIAHTYTTFVGGHEDKLPERIEKYAMPFVTNLLDH